MTDLPAGREMDALIAEKVMGHPFIVGVWSCPEYSTDIAAAWLVVDEMGRRGFHARVKSPFVPMEPYFAGFTPHGMAGWNGRPDHEGDGDTPSLAICRAALAAVDPT